MVKPLVVSHSDYQGGAARAAWRLHQSLVRHGAESTMLVGTKASGDWRVRGPEGKLGRGMASVRPTIDGLIQRLQRSENRVLHSPAWLGGISQSAINCMPHDVVNLHWTCAGFLSVESIGRLVKPVVWTMHDMWPFSGSEHYALDLPDSRWRQGYKVDNRPSGHSLLDVDRWVWNRKRRAWRSPFRVVTPSNWLANCVRQSALMNSWPVTVIPNALDLEVFKPIDKALARFVLNLPQDKEVVLFGALGGSEDPRKGWDLLQPALKRISAHRHNMHAVVLGQREPETAPDTGMPTTWAGHLSDDPTLALFYSAADVMIVPSRQENLPQSATEAQACGCPVVAFDVTGLPDAVEHEVTGYLARHLTADSLESGIEWILTDCNRAQQLSTNARRKAINSWGEKRVSSLYMELFEEAVREHSIR